MRTASESLLLFQFHKCMKVAMLLLFLLLLEGNEGCKNYGNNMGLVKVMCFNSKMSIGLNDLTFDGFVLLHFLKLLCSKFNNKIDNTCHQYYLF